MYNLRAQETKDKESTLFHFMVKARGKKTFIGLHKLMHTSS